MAGGRIRQSTSSMSKVYHVVVVVLWRFIVFLYHNSLSQQLSGAPMVLRRFAVDDFIRYTDNVDLRQDCAYSHTM